uniref:C-type lectin domain-containing protein n=1 Tax=Sander lucioperca TaxID=283035 RepID=A0A8C9Z6D1_SANLU
MASGFPFALLLCLSIGLLAASVSKNYGQTPCPPGWTQFGSRCFTFHIQTKSWPDAENFCIAAGGTLASIHSAAENTFLKNFINQVSGTYKNSWIGGFDVLKGTWMWADGSKFDYRIFNAGQPDNTGGAENCLEMNFGGHNWNDRPCGTPLSFVCSKNLCV